MTDNPSSILVIQLKRAGDVIVTTPVLTALKTKFPRAHLAFLVDKPFAVLLEHHPALDAIEIYDRNNVWATWQRIRAQRYDWIFDFQSSPRSALLCARSGARITTGYAVPFWGRLYDRTVKRPGASLSTTDGKFTLVEALTGPLGERPARRLFLSTDEKQWAANVITAPAIALVPTHRRNSRRWHAESFAEVGRQWQSKGATVWLFWGPGEQAYVKAIAEKIPGSRLIPPTTLRQMGSLLQRCQVVITNDNGPMHLAVAVGAPTVTIYGPTDPKSWNPGGPRHLALQAAGLSCLGCNLNECPFSHECMTQVTSERVFLASQKLVEFRP
jgi:ADP-heptose:LPS heptosyltransferase